MESSWVGRLRWRRRGAWLWPAFVAATVADAVIGHELPASGDSETIGAAAVAALVINLIAVILLSRPLGLLLRRRRRDMPLLIARNYGGTVVVALVTVAFAAAGFVHHSTITSNQHALRDAIVRAQAWIGARAPATFRRNLQWVDTFAIEPCSIYRACVPSEDHRRTFCVIVDTKRPFPSSVRFSGYEPNSTFSEGVS
jgi:hypothetical protein